MTERALEHADDKLQLPSPHARVLAFTADQASDAHHLVLPDAPEAALCGHTAPSDAPLSSTLTGSLCVVCRATGASIGINCSSCGLPLLAEFDPDLCFACTCRKRGF